ncbi:MAG TPA: helix-turn-helix transcriptional regulator [Gemmatimonadales bacterium]|nr:helix-turn-helix transcriptional regulator [Gemmatimonadales bacterium]
MKPSSDIVTLRTRPVRASTEARVGSAFRDRSRTFLPIEVTLRVDCGKRRKDGEKRHFFSWEEVLRRSEADVNAPSPRAHPVRIAREWKHAMEERGESRAELARRLGISRARVSQVLGVLDLAPDVLELLEQESGPGIVSERSLR